MGAKGKAISPEYKKAIVFLKGYFDRTQDDNTEKNINSVEKTSHALEVGVATVKRVMAEYNRDPKSIEIEKFQRGHPPKIIDESLQTVTRDYIRTANQEGKYITLDMLLKYLLEFNDKNSFSVRTLGRALDRWGFTFGKGTRSQHLKEKNHVIAARRRYLSAMRENRNGEL